MRWVWSIPNDSRRSVQWATALWSLMFLGPLPAAGPVSLVDDVPGRTVAIAAQTIAAGGSDFVCGIRSDLTLACWGRPTLDLGEPPAGLFAVVAAGRRDVCALAIDSTMTCWGRWYAGGAPRGGAPTGRAVQAPDGRFLTLDVADSQACAVGTDQSLTCWGLWQDDARSPLDGPPVGRYVAVAAVHDWFGGCAIRTDGSIDCWGPDTWGEATPPPGTFKAIDAGRQMYCAIATGGTLSCWGRRLYGMGEPPPGRYVALAIGGDTGCAIAEERTVTCWGAQVVGAPRPPKATAAAITVGDTIAAMVAEEGTVHQWGETAYWPAWGFGPPPLDRFAAHRVIPVRPDG